MKRILLAIATVVTALSVAGFSTYAAWTDAVTVTNNIITTGTVDLRVSTDNGTTWNSASAVSGMTLANLVPGAAATEAYSFSLNNNSTGITTMALTGQIVPATSNVVDKSQLMIEVYNTATGVAEVPAVTLAAWEAGAQNFATTLATGASRHYGIRAYLLSTAGNEWQGQTVTFVLQVTGSQP